MMCGNTNCTLAKQDRNKLRRLCVELAGPEGADLRDFNTDAGHLIFDVCEALTIEQVVVMDAKTVYAIRNEGKERLWPCIEEGAGDELAETDAIREGVKVDEHYLFIRDEMGRRHVAYGSMLVPSAD